MSEVASAAPSYVTRLALKAMPFNEAVDATIYFNGQFIEQSLNLSLHLASSSDKLALIQTANGVGKTCLLAQFAARADDNLKVTLIQGQYAPDAKTVLFQCLRDFGVDEYDIRTSDDHQVLLQTRVFQLRQLDVRPVILIDDADKLSSEVLELLISWLSWQQDSTYLMQGVICTKHVIPALDTIKSRLQTVDLSQLTPQEIEPYLTTRLKQVGYTGAPVFNKKQLKRFFKQSNGNPATLNKLAHQTLLGVEGPLKSVARPQINWRMLFKGIGGSIVAVALIIVLIFQDDINGLFEQKDEQQQVEVIAPEPELAIVEVPIVSQEQYNRDELVGLVAELEQESLLSEAPLKLVPDLKNQQWVFEQQPNNYTYQLMGSWEKQELNEFVATYALEGNVAAFESLRNGKVWHVLIYGVYPDKQAALEASQAWPAPLNTLPSWLRRFDSVQKQIKGDS